MQVSGFAGIPGYWFTGLVMQVCGSTGTESVGLWTYCYAGIPVYWYTGIPVYRYTGIPVYWSKRLRILNVSGFTSVHALQLSMDAGSRVPGFTALRLTDLRTCETFFWR